MKKLNLILLGMLIAAISYAQVPTFNFAKQMGGSAADATGYAIVSDAGGNIYTAGLFLGIVDFNPAAAVFNLSSGTNTSFFVSKIRPGRKFLWAKK
ncbi:MAG: hypothetical protein IPO27_03130 [Bacteroidetes bacterium]|nr:hypothetical protein [Bacteroidota bacterium]